MHHRNLVISAALVAAFGAASAQEASTSTDIVHGTVAGHRYRSGGVGRDQVLSMSRGLDRYSLRLGFTEGRHDAYLADVVLKVFDAAGRPMFTLPDAGPLVDIRLPAGQYRVVANASGVERAGRVDVRSGHLAELNLHWAKDPAA